MYNILIFLIFARKLLKANAYQVIRCSDWPHMMHKGTTPNDGDLTDPLLAWVPDKAQRLRERVLVNNPARLCGF